VRRRIPLPRDPRPRRRIQLKTIQVLPTLVTAGNLLSGLLALSYLMDAAAATDLARQDALHVKAAWMIFLGMFCDALDGRLARLMRTTSPFGAQLDSLADVVTFGVVPAVMCKAIFEDAFPLVAPRLALALVGVYVLGAALRLARYNAESARVAAGEGPHVTQTFRGLPSPAAAGVVASIVLLRHEHDMRWLEWALLFGMPVLGVLMISRMPYSHVVNRWVEGRKPLLPVVLLAVAAFLAVSYFEATVAAAFLAYALSGVVIWVAGVLTGRPAWAFREDEDELGDETQVERAPEPAPREEEIGREAP
jgi:CDP-diacylglycerol--serine O-phosphatidyltransferase